MTKRLASWVQCANSADTDFPLNNLPYGVFNTAATTSPRCGVAIGDQILDCKAAHQAGLLEFEGLTGSSWNAIMEAGPQIWAAFRARLQSLLAQGSEDRAACQAHLVPQSSATMHMPFIIAEFTDFYAGRHHATNVGTMFRGAENALPPNWLHMPIGYNGRASSVVLSGSDVRRPIGQVKRPDEEVPRFAPSARFDFELELGAVVGTASNDPVDVDTANAMIFGYMLLNDWSSRDMQAWEYQPLGPFQAKATATSISPWIVSTEALKPFAVDTPPREKALLDYIKDTGPMLYDIDLTIDLTPKDGTANRIAATNYREMYYSSAQQIAHHTVSGCPMRVGDLIGSGTISGPDRLQRGSMLELSWGGKEPITLSDGSTRTFLNDGDSVAFSGAAHGPDYNVGFGECVGKILPAQGNNDPG